MGDNSSQLIVISAPDHHIKLVDGLQQLLATQHRLDFFFKVGGRSVRAHRLVLDVFLSLDKLGRNGAVNSSMNGSNLDQLIEFAYSGRVEVCRDQLAELLRLGRQLDFKLLVEAMESTTEAAGLVDEPTDRVCRHRSSKRAADTTVNYEEEMSDHESGHRSSSVDNSWNISRRRKRVVSGRVKPATVKDVQTCTNVGAEDNDSGAVTVARAGGRKADSAKKSVTGKKGRLRPIWRCQLCDYKSIRKALFQLHLSKHDPTVRTFKCDACTKPFACEVSLRRHKCVRGTGADTAKTVTEPAVYECAECDYKCHVESFYKLHLAKHDSTITVYRCQRCPRKFLREESLLCHKCSPAYAAAASSKGAGSGAPKTHVCPHCDYATRDKYRFTIHASKHDPDVTVLRCDDCRKAFFTQEALSRHKLHHVTYRCQHCDHETQKSWRHYDHLFAVHGVNTKGETLPKMRCPHCDFSCRTEGLLKNHVVAKHSGEKPYTCDQCSFSSCHKSAIPQHVKIVHLGIKPQMCEECGYRAVSQSALNKHKLSHTGEKPFKCKQCEKAYSDITALKRHAGTHGRNEKPWICHVCAYASNRRSNLNVHLRKVHKLPVEPPTIRYAPKPGCNLYSL